MGEDGGAQVAHEQVEGHHEQGHDEGLAQHGDEALGGGHALLLHHGLILLDDGVALRGDFVAVVDDDVALVHHAVGHDGSGVFLVEVFGALDGVVDHVGHQILADGHLFEGLLLLGGGQQRVEVGEGLALRAEGGGGHGVGLVALEHPHLRQLGVGHEVVHVVLDDAVVVDAFHHAHDLHACACVHIGQVHERVVELVELCHARVVVEAIEWHETLLDAFADGEFGDGVILDGHIEGCAQARVVPRLALHIGELDALVDKEARGEHHHGGDEQDDEDVVACASFHSWPVRGFFT